MMRGFLLCVLVVSAAAVVAEDVPAKMAADAIPNYKLMRPGVATGGQPSAETLGKLKALGFKTIVNLRTPGEDPIVDQEAKAVGEQGLTYVAVPVTPATLSAADVAAVRKVLDDPNAAP